MPPEYFDRTGKKITREEHLKLFSDTNYKTLRQTRLRDGTFISTVWLGMSHGASPSGPLIFETMVFPPPSAKNKEEEQYRYSSEELALEHHKKLVGFEEGQDESLKLVDLDRWRSIAEDTE